MTFPNDIKGLGVCCKKIKRCCVYCKCCSSGVHVPGAITQLSERQGTQASVLR